MALVIFAAGVAAGWMFLPGGDRTGENMTGASATVTPMTATAPIVTPAPVPEPSQADRLAGEVCEYMARIRETERPSDELIQAAREKTVELLSDPDVTSDNITAWEASLAPYFSGA